MIVERRFRGPPDSANGGYFAGLVAGHLTSTPADPYEVTLRRPPPLGAPMQVLAQSGTARVVGPSAAEPDDQPFATAEAMDFALAPPAPVGVDEAEAAAERYVWRGHDHPFPGCFVCGPDRGQGDGLRLFPGAVGGGRGVAAVWRPDASLPQESGRIRSEIIWAALDCPSFFGAAGDGPATPPTALLGRIRAVVHANPRVGETLVVQGWGISVEGRKIRAASAVRTPDGEVLAAAITTWITLR